MACAIVSGGFVYLGEGEPQLEEFEWVKGVLPYMTGIFVLMLAAVWKTEEYLKWNQLALFLAKHSTSRF